jgi:hypothetical protein
VAAAIYPPLTALPPIHKKKRRGKKRDVACYVSTNIANISN